MHRTTKPLDPGVATGDRWSLEVMLMLNGDGLSLLRIARRCATRVMLVGSLALVACGENRNVIELDNGFDVGVGIVRQVPPAPYGNSGPENLGAVLTFDMHMAEKDKDCMVREAFAARSPEIPPEGYNWSAEELNELATRCNVDFSEMYRDAGG